MTRRPGKAPPPRGLAVAVRTAKGRTGASQRWLARQLNDPYVQAAKQQGWRSRAAFKLAELDDRFHLIRRGARVVDLGAAPGGWTQVAVRGGAARVVAVDLLPMDPVPGSVVLLGDFTEPAIQATADRDAGRQGRSRAVGHGAEHHRAHRHRPSADHGAGRGGAGIRGRGARRGRRFVAKVFQGGAERQMLDRLKRRFATVRHAKPPASRKESSELYVVAMGFRLPT